MPFYRLPGVGTIHVKFSGKLAKNPPAPCCARIEVGNVNHRCNAMSAFLCDWPVEGGTCDAPMCEEHAHQVAADRHYCPRHARDSREREPELF